MEAVTIMLDGLSEPVGIAVERLVKEIETALNERRRLWEPVLRARKEALGKEYEAAVSASKGGAATTSDGAVAAAAQVDGPVSGPVEPAVTEDDTIGVQSTPRPDAATATTESTAAATLATTPPPADPSNIDKPADALTTEPADPPITAITTSKREIKKKKHWGETQDDFTSSKTSSKVMKKAPPRPSPALSFMENPLEAVVPDDDGRKSFKARLFIQLVRRFRSSQALFRGH